MHAMRCLSTRDIACYRARPWHAASRSSNGGRSVLCWALRHSASLNHRCFLSAGGGRSHNGEGSACPPAGSGLFRHRDDCPTRARVENSLDFCICICICLCNSVSNLSIYCWPDQAPVKASRLLLSPLGAPSSSDIIAITKPDCCSCQPAIAAHSLIAVFPPLRGQCLCISSSCHQPCARRVQLKHSTGVASL
ncbi:hypothetical protein BU23DRAFT_633 [Bimuria novae-zelandiae CBS 107.79]|uniref:Uncharacterized protein n=1 Tax=Bimuria novae-zelandiae CBS 107.79 TaxID=1447943 RepID=A0A6A5VSY8_9PLEO|nr:hypothetical protein BU23DRAFT_633 [Bimuria novae-zelandiae CBS 107.79]